MPVDPYASEPTTEIPLELWDQYRKAREAAERWEEHVAFLEGQIRDLIGDTHAGLVGGKKVVTYRPTATYSVKALREAYPELAQHFERDVLKVEFDMAAFAKQHEEIARQYRSRSFRMVT